MLANHGQGDHSQLLAPISTTMRSHDRAQYPCRLLVRKHALPHKGRLCEHRFQTFQLHPLAADLDLRIEPPDQLDGAAPGEPGAVAGPVGAPPIWQPHLPHRFAPDVLGKNRQVGVT
eukprot:COSAG01_NODE_232_length_21016_cov_51.558876_25_plen_117_part_00